MHQFIHYRSSTTTTTNINKNNNKNNNLPSSNHTRLNGRNKEEEEINQTKIHYISPNLPCNAPSLVPGICKSGGELAAREEHCDYPPVMNSSRRGRRLHQGHPEERSSCILVVALTMMVLTLDSNYIRI
ncbi:hypothetical protein E2C01_023810 [Portunus trituberculatus]|uniref:Uncharacterized protein n=1 Tax=Portunus trituberculatus TaxID=210409 RepID=A0A5B7EC53_PORTR|nr:hypothetical protein [Portunus trituberculatus]